MNWMRRWKSQRPAWFDKPLGYDWELWHAPVNQPHRNIPDNDHSAFAHRYRNLIAPSLR